ncbi:toll/interleukin-1 receptor domain-containing protein [Thioalkalivibrio sp. XN8]|uniref:toll/interleukin-1 receptor domain-containing protein n=1 Tax=Thioalkalivibrio sp. XN8 TaxID=2712863 RepID=UPI0013ED250E|nr:toll/interleukin-1 receptor domain-containing protein [Thioalkalivibrio sp. XN8]NGP51972.1 toll/interleukin-1 receptor domain-containing protein [Thioalkalivibrio sp. XN8]
MTEFALPSKLIPAFRRLRQHYQRRAESELCALIEASSIFAKTGTDYDPWDGGTYGHDVYIFLPEEMLGLLDLDEQAAMQDRIQEDLRKATPEVENEYVRAVYINARYESDPNVQQSTPFSIEPIARPQDVGLWKANALRLFISHRDEDKLAARSLANALEAYGVSAFVAHDAIKPMKEWQKEILNGLATMEVMLVLLSDRFHESVWTNQEVGFALGRGIPIICLKIGNLNPKGFLSAHQAMKRKPEELELAASDILKSLLGEVRQAGRVKEVLIEAFISSGSYHDAIANLKRLTETTDKLTESDFDLIAKGYAENDQLHTCVGIHNRRNWFKRYLESATGKELEFNGKQILESSRGFDDDIPL